MRHKNSGEDEYFGKLSKNDQDGLLSIDLDTFWVNSDVLREIYNNGLSDRNLGLVFEEMEDEIFNDYQLGASRRFFDKFIAQNPELVEWMERWRMILISHYNK